MIEYRIECLQAEGGTALPGYEAKPHSEKPLIVSLTELGIVTRLFPLHSPAELDALSTAWISSVSPYFRADAVDQLRSYFGDEVAIYFAFVRQLSLFLLPPASLPFFECLWPAHLVSRHVAMATFNMIWLTIFIECWKRSSAQLAFRWGTIKRHALERPRPAYFGRMRVSEVTGQVERYYPKWKRRLRFWLVSAPVMAVSFQVTFSLMLGYLWLDEAVLRWAGTQQSVWTSVVVALPGVGYSVLLIVMNAAFRKLARLLTDFENHRLQSAYDNNYVMKLIAFYSINGFLCLFYKAFYIGDLAAVRDTLATLLITSQVVNQVMECVIPLVTYHVAKRLQGKSEDASRDERLLKRVEKESLLPQVEGMVDEYIELYLQFGYVFLFSSLLPWAAICALVNNLVELKTDAFKLCRLYQRPFSKIASGIGAWRYGFEFLAFLAVATNCGLIFLSPEVQATAVKTSNALTVFACFVVLEHLLFCLKAAIAAFIQDQPKNVRRSLAREEYLTQKAWQDELRQDRGERAKKD